MLDTATPLQRRRQETLLRIHSTAIRLTLGYGFDGFTMEDLAREVNLSRRSLFNYVGDKITAVLGADDTLSEQREQEFAGAPMDGDPLGRLLRFASGWAAESDAGAEATAIATQMRIAVASEPKLARETARRASAVVDRMSVLISQREGWGPDDVRARVIARTVHMLLEEAIDLTLSHAGTEAVTLSTNFERVLTAFRSVTKPSG